MQSVGDLYIKLGLSSASFTAGLQQAKQQVNDTAGAIKSKLTVETREAHAAGQLLSHMFGVQLPREVTRFVSTVGPVRTVLASAFQATIVGAFGIAVVEATVKAVEFFNEWRTGAGVMREFEKAAANANENIKQLGLSTAKAALEEIRSQRALLEAQIAGREARVRAGGFGLPGDRTGLVGAVQANREIIELAVQSEKLWKTEGDLIKRVSELAKESTNTAGAWWEQLIKNENAAFEKARVKAIEFRKLMDQLFFKGTGPMQEEQPTLFRKAELEAMLAGTREVKETAAAMGQLRIGQRDFGQEELQVWEATLTRAERYNVELNRLKVLLMALGPSFQQTFERAKKALDETFTTLGQFKRGLQEISQNSLMSIGDAALGLRSWKDVFRQIIADLARLVWYLLMVQPLMGALFPGSGGGGGLFGGGGVAAPTFSGPGKAAGGFIGPGQWGTVGEAGPEMAFGGRTGLTIVPAMRGGGEGGLVVHIDARGADLGTIVKLNRVMLESNNKGLLKELRDRGRRTA